MIDKENMADLSCTGSLEYVGCMGHPHWGKQLEKMDRHTHTHPAPVEQACWPQWDPRLHSGQAYGIHRAMESCFHSEEFENLVVRKIHSLEQILAMDWQRQLPELLLLLTFIQGSLRPIHRCPGPSSIHWSSSSSIGWGSLVR